MSAGDVRIAEMRAYAKIGAVYESAPGVVIAKLARMVREAADDIEASRADRDRLASELQDVCTELETARNALRDIWPFVEEDDGGFATAEYQSAIDACRAALADLEGGAK